MAQRAFVHIGTHKTGTTALQRWAQANQEELAAKTGIYYYQGCSEPNHYELPMLCLRRNRNMPMRKRDVDWCLDAWRADVREHVRRQVERPIPDLLMSAESLSLLRYADEVRALEELVSPRTIEVAVVLREPRSFLESYREELKSQRRPLSPYPDSYAYVEDDSWLVRYDELLDVYRCVLGSENVHVLSYEQSLARFGSTIPAVLEAFGADPTDLPEWEGVWLNSTDQRPRSRRFVLRAGRRILKSLRRQRLRI